MTLCSGLMPACVIAITKMLNARDRIILLASLLDALFRGGSVAPIAQR
jgi:hypothetical protein